MPLGMLLGGLFGSKVKEPSWEEQTQWARDAWQTYGADYTALQASRDRDMEAEKARLGAFSPEYQAYARTRNLTYNNELAELKGTPAGEYLREYHKAEYQGRRSRWQSLARDRMRKAGFEGDLPNWGFGNRNPEEFMSGLETYVGGMGGPGAQQQGEQYLQIAREEIDQTPQFESNMVQFYTNTFGEPMAPGSSVDPEAAPESSPELQRAMWAASGRRISGGPSSQRLGSPWIS